MSSALTRMAICLAVLLGSGSLALAQYTADKVDPRLSRRGSSIKRLCREPLASAEDKQQFDDFFDKYYFPELTQYAPDKIGALGKLRYDLFRNFIWPSHPAIQADLTKRAYDFSRKVLGSNKYHPSVRYNGVLILGMLDKEYPVEAGANRRPPKPLPDANKLLCKIIELCAKEQRLPTYMQVGALIGLERHARFIMGMPAADRDRTAKMLQLAATQKTFAPDTSRDVQNWLKIKAGSGIAALGVAGPQGAFVTTLINLTLDPKIDLDNRCLLASLVSGIPMEGVPQTVSAGAVEAFKQLCCDVAADELDIATEFENLQRRGRRRGPSLTDESPRFSYEDQAGVVYRRQGLISRLQRLQKGLQSLGSVAGSDQPMFEAASKAITGAVSAARDKGLIDLDMVEEVKTAALEIQQLVGCKATESGAEDIALDLP